MFELLLKLLLAHIIGDFVLQPSTWVKDKEAKKIKSKYLYGHLFVHGAALVLCLMPNTEYWPGVLVILGTHYLIDLGKLYLNAKFAFRILFIMDQILHLVVLAFVVNHYEPLKVDFNLITSPQVMLLLVSLLTCTHVIGVVMKLFLSRWQVDIEKGQDEEEAAESMSLQNAGIYIGMLERLFVFFFVISGQFSGIGFLLAAKSVFRFGDLSRAKDRKLTEYILIGTLLSFGFSILIAKAYLYLRAWV